jgi:hypothetical protein
MPKFKALDFMHQDHESQSLKANNRSLCDNYSSNSLLTLLKVLFAKIEYPFIYATAIECAEEIYILGT